MHLRATDEEVSGGGSQGKPAVQSHKDSDTKTRFSSLKEAQYLASKIQCAKLVPMGLFALIHLPARGSLTLWADFCIETGRDVPLATIPHMSSGWLISGLCLAAGLLCDTLRAMSFAEAEKVW